jgi:hypothetical protein
VWEAVERVAIETNSKLIACGTSKCGVKATVPTSLPNGLVQGSNSHRTPARVPQGLTL